MMNAELLEKLVNAFVAWPLPESVCSDDCCTMPNYPHRSGTNLLNAHEARQMFEYLLAKCGINELERQHLDDGDEIEKLCSTILGAKFVRGDSYGVPGPLACVDAVVERCAELKRQNEALRAALSDVQTEARLCLERDECEIDCETVLEICGPALQSDAGRDCIPDDPQSDGTDAAHPAWWRGHEAGCLGLARRLQDAVDGRDDGKGVVGHERIEKLRRDILAMRRDFIPREQVEPLAQALNGIKSACNPWQQLVVINDAGLHCLYEALEHAKTLGF